MYNCYDYKKSNNESKEVKRTLYVNTIGAKSDEIMRTRIFRNYKCLDNPRIKKTNYGPFKCRKYSFLLTDEDFKKIKDIIQIRFINDHIKDIRVLCEINNNNNIYVIDQIDF